MASIDMPDLVNGALEFIAAGFIFLNVLKIHRTKSAASVHWATTMFMTIWGFWNIYYYPHLSQYISFLGCLFIAVTNTAYLILVLRYWNND